MIEAYIPEAIIAPSEEPAVTPTPTPGTETKKPCACEEHKRKMRENAERVSDEQISLCRMHKGVSVLLTILLVLAVINVSKKLFA